MRQLLHISDVHFGPPHLAERAEGLLGLAGREHPDLVVLSGDLTQRAKPGQFREAREFVDQMPVPTLTVPGNHDVPLYRFWERFLDPYGAYRRNFAVELEPMFSDEELLVIGINTAHGRTFKDGRISSRRLLEVENLLDAADPGQCKIIVQHHEMIPPPWFGNFHVMKGSDQVMELYQRAGVDLVLSGHWHQMYLGSSEEYYPNGETPVRVLHSGTSASDRGRGGEKGRNSCNWIRIEAETIEIAHLMWEGSSGAFAVWSRHLLPRRHTDPYGLPKREETRGIP